MNNIKTPSLDGDKIVEQYPFSIGVFKKWLGTFPNAEEAGLGKDGLIYDNALKAIFYFNPRSLYDFFDKMGLELIVGRVDNHWYFTVRGDLGSFHADTRIVAEEQGFQLCFDILEKGLTK